MYFVALRMITGDRLKYMSLVFGLAFAALLITQQSSIFTGYSTRMGAWLHDTNVADLWVMNDQVEFVEDIKPMLDNTLNRVRSIAGVQWAVPLYKNYLKCRLPDGTQIQVRIIGVDDTSLIGAPAEFVEGKLEDLRSDRAVIMNAKQATDILRLKRTPGNPPLKVGDFVSFNDHEARIVGSFKASPEFFWEPVFYTTYARAITMAPQERKSLTYILVKVKPGLDVQRVAQDIHNIVGVNAIASADFETISRDYLFDKTGILVNFGMTILLGFIIGVLVAGQTLYAFMVEHTKYFATIKAMGATNSTIIRMVIVQVMVVGFLGYGIGLGGACITGVAFASTGLAFKMVWQIPVLGAGAILFCCLVSACIGLQRVLRLEPGIVFKG